MQLAWQQQQQGLRLLLASLVLLPHLLLLLALAHQLQLLPLAWLPALNLLLLLLLLQALPAAVMTRAQWRLSHTDQRLIPTRHLHLLQQQRPPHPAAAAVVQPYQLPLARFLAVGAYAPAPLVHTLPPSLMHLVITHCS
jgi:hypothetical protein